MNSSQRRSELDLGVFWPANIFEEVEGKSIPKAELDTHVHKGVRLRGKLRDAKFGCPTGCLRLVDVDSSEVRKQTEVSHSDNTLRPKELEDTHKELLSAHSATVVKEKIKDEATGEDIATHRIGRRGSFKTDDDDSSDDWASCLRQRDTVVAHEALAKTPNKAKLKGNKRKADDEDKSSDDNMATPHHKRPKSKAKPKSSPKSKASPRNAPSSSSHSSARRRVIYPSEQQRQINDCNTRIAEVRALLDSATNPDGLLAFVSENGKRLTNSLGKLSKKTCEQIEYVLTYANDDLQAKGAEVQEKLNQVAAAGKALLQVVTAMRAEPGSLIAMSSYLATSCQRCVELGIDLPHTVLDELMRRTSAEFIDGGRLLIGCRHALR